MVRSSALSSLPWLRHGFTCRAGGVSPVYGSEGDLNLGFTAGDEAWRVRRNRELALELLGGDAGGKLFTVHQVHGTAVLPVTRAEIDARGGAAPAAQADAMITGEPDVVLGIQVADCVPVLLADARLRVIAAVHAGWKGTAAGIVQLAVARLALEYGSRPQDLIGAIGPSIGPCCYTVGEEVRAIFRANLLYADELIQTAAQGMRLDLWEANRRQLLGAGLLPANIQACGECTGCTYVEGRRRYFSHRAEQGVTGRAMGLIGMVQPHTTG